MESVTTLLPFSFAFAAGAMLSLIAIEMLPQAYAKRPRLNPTLGLLAGAAVMLALDLALGV